MAAGHNPADDELALLTPKERFILQRIALGESSADIGAELGVKPKTVKNYVAALLVKLGMSGNRTQAAILLAQSSDAPAAINISLDDLDSEERLIAQDLAKGLRATEVATKVHVSPKTISRKRRNLLRKMGLTTCSLSGAAVQLSLALSREGKR
jgi:DNA-binding NarL/FixJ family response regulator